MTTLTKICAWCNKDMGEIDGDGVEGVSHGICDECRERLSSGTAVPRDKDEQNEMPTG